MAVDLYLTPTRRALLREVADGNVIRLSGGESVVLQPTRDRKVTAEVAAMERAGWIVLVEMRFGAKRWDLTDAGREQLAATAKGG